MIESVRELIDNIDIVCTYTYQFVIGDIDLVTYKRRMIQLWHLLVKR